MIQRVLNAGQKRQWMVVLAALVCALALTALGARTAQAQTMTQVTVQRNDTLSKIAARNCTTWQEIYNLNRAVIGGNPSVITAGTVLTVPNRCGGNQGGNQGGIWDRGPRVHATGSFNAPWYTVAWGDTLTSIAQRFGTTVQTIRNQNNIRGNNINPGQVLLIGGGGVTPPVVPTPQPPVVQPNNTERVQFEEWQISAQRTGIIQGAVPMRYILNARAGQSISLFTQSFGSPLLLEVTAPTGQPVKLAGTNSAMQNSVSGFLPASGDYIVVVVPIPDGVQRFQFNFNITFVIQ